MVNLRRTVTGVGSGKIGNVPTARAIGNELANFATLVARIDNPTSLPWQMAYMTAKFMGHLYMFPARIQKKVTTAYAEIDDFEELVRPSFVWREKEAFSRDRLEQIETKKQMAGEVIAEAAMELLQFGYPEE